MTEYTWLVPLPVVLPLVAAGLTLALFRLPRAQRIISVVALSLMVCAGTALLVLDILRSLGAEIDRHGEQGGRTDPGPLEALEPDSIGGGRR